MTERNREELNRDVSDIHARLAANNARAWIVTALFVPSSVLGLFADLSPLSLALGAVASAMLIISWFILFEHIRQANMPLESELKRLGRELGISYLDAAVPKPGDRSMLDYLLSALTRIPVTVLRMLMLFTVLALWFCKCFC